MGFVASILTVGMHVWRVHTVVWLIIVFSCSQFSFHDESLFMAPILFVVMQPFYSIHFTGESVLLNIKADLP